MDVMKLMVVALAGWINRQQRDASGLADCSATTTGTRHEIDDSSFWTLRFDSMLRALPLILERIRPLRQVMNPQPRGTVCLNRARADL